MAVFNRAELLKNAIKSLSIQTRIPDEIVIVDDWSDAKNDLKLVLDNFPWLNIKLLRRESKLWNNPPIPLNWSVKNATWDLIIFSFPDIIHYNFDNIERLEKMFEENSNQCIVGAKIYWQGKDVLLPENIVENPKLIDDFNVKTWYNWFVSKDDEVVITEDLQTSNIMAVTRENFIKLWGFDEELSQSYWHEDSEFLNRCHNNEIKVSRDNSIIWIHQWHKRPPVYAVANLESKRDYLNARRKILTANDWKDWGNLI